MPASKPNVVLVTVDCLRRDRLSAYGYDRPTTPFLDSLLPMALHASSAHAASSWTCPSVASLLTGLYPSRHGAGWLPGPVNDLERDRLPSALHTDTLAFPQYLPGHANAVFTAVPFATMPVADRFAHVRVRDCSADVLVGEALRWMSEQTPPQPFLTWIHLGDTHDPLDVPADLRDVFGPVKKYREARRWRYTRGEGGSDPSGFASYRADRIRLYDAAVHGVDRAIQTLWEAVQEREEDTILLVSADHGEEMWEHQEEEQRAFLDPRGVSGVGHGHNLFQVHLLVPLLILGPGVPAREVAVNTSLVDVVPTLLELLGEPIPGGLDGRSLLGMNPSIRNGVNEGHQRPVRAEAVAYGHEKRTLIVGDEKILVSPGDNYAAATLLGPDRTETATAPPPGTLERLAALLAEDVQAPVRGPSMQANEEVVAHLRHLGYLE